MPLFRALRASMAMPFAHANTAASERASALSVGCSNPVFGRREYFHVLRLFNALQAGKFPIPFSEPRAAICVRRSAGAAGTSRAAVFASSRVVAVAGAASRRSPVLIRNARRAFTRGTSLATGRRRPTVVGEGGRGSRRIEAQGHERDPQTEPGRRSTVTRVVFYGKINVTNSEKDNWRSDIERHP